MKKIIFIKLIFILFIFTSISCNIQTGKTHYILAEKLFNDQKYEAAKTEFLKVIEIDPKSSHSQKARLRLAKLEHIYLEQYIEAIKSYREFVFYSDNQELNYECEKAIADIFYSKLENYTESLNEYKKLYDNYPKSKERPFFLYQIARSHYGLLNFKKAIDTFQTLIELYPDSEFAVQAEYQIGNSLFTSGECEEAIKSFKKFIEKYSNNKYVVDAKLELADCLAELHKDDQAMSLYEELYKIDSLKKVIEIKINRLKNKLVYKKGK